MEHESAFETVATLFDKEIATLLEEDKKNEAHELHQAKGIVTKALRGYSEMYVALQMLRSVLSKLS